MISKNRLIAICPKGNKSSICDYPKIEKEMRPSRTLKYLIGKID